MPRFSLSTEVLLPAYVGRMSLPMSSITASSCEYLLWDWCCCTSCWVWSCWVCSCCRCCCCSCNSCCWLSCMACAAPWPRLIWLGEGVARTSSDRGVPGLLITAGELTLLRSLGVDILSSITCDFKIPSCLVQCTNTRYVLLRDKQWKTHIIYKIRNSK